MKKPPEGGLWNLSSQGETAEKYKTTLFDKHPRPQKIFPELEMCCRR
jgi:hypothetical protein